MAKGNRVPLSARERNGMISLLVVGLLLIGGGFFVRTCSTGTGLPPGIIRTSDTDTVDTGSLYYNSEAQKYIQKHESSVSENSGNARRRNKSRRDKTDSTQKRSSGKKKTKTNANPQEYPQRRHLEEDLSETR